jgi:hypothetical protein
LWIITITKACISPSFPTPMTYIDMPESVSDTHMCGSIQLLPFSQICIGAYVSVLVSCLVFVSSSTLHSDTLPYNESPITEWYFIERLKQKYKGRENKNMVASWILPPVLYIRKRWLFTFIEKLMYLDYNVV